MSNPGKPQGEIPSVDFSGIRAADKKAVENMLAEAQKKHDATSGNII